MGGGVVAEPMTTRQTDTNSSLGAIDVNPPTNVTNLRENINTFYLI